METIEHFLTGTLQLKNRDLITQLSGIGEVHHFKEKSILFHHGQNPDYVAFLINGITRGYYIDSQGKEATDCFDYQFGAPLVASLPLDAPAIISIEALTECDIFIFPIEIVIGLLKSDVSIAQLYNALLIESLKKYIRLTRALTKYSTEQRYQWFLSEYPELERKVSDKYIASFLNMSTVTLSRVRKKIGISKKYIRK